VPQPRPPYAPTVEIDLTETRRTAEAVAAEWGLELGDPFELSYASYVAPAGDGRVLKVSWAGDDESLDEAAALELWGGDAAVRIIRSDAARRAILEERADPGTDLAGVQADDAIAVAVALGRALWRPAGPPFRRVADFVPAWLENRPSELTPLARELLADLDVGSWLVHGDFHHHNVLRHHDRWIAIDPKPYLADREYDVYTWLHNPRSYVPNRDDVERRIARFVAAGLDDRKIRAWTIVRAAYLNPSADERAVFGSLLD
jgi:streptomycin 6-kinase